RPGCASPLGQVTGRYKDQNTAAAAAATARATSKSRGALIGLPRRGTHGACGAGTFTTGRVFIVSSCVILRHPAPRIVEVAVFFPADAMRAFPVGSMVSNPRKDVSECLGPA